MLTLISSHRPPEFGAAYNPQITHVVQTGNSGLKLVWNWNLVPPHNPKIVNSSGYQGRKEESGMTGGLPHNSSLLTIIWRLKEHIV